MSRAALIFGVVFCLTGVMVGAFGAHALADLLILNAREDVFDLANRYQFYHGLGLMLVGVISHQRMLSVVLVRSVVLSMVFGATVFCGSLYALALTNVAWLGAVTPIGGFFLIVAWVLFIRALMGRSQGE